MWEFYPKLTILAEVIIYLTLNVRAADVVSMKVCKLVTVSTLKAGGLYVTKDLTTAVFTVSYIWAVIGVLVAV